MSTRDSLIQHARDLYVEAGLSGLSMRAVGQRAGVSATAIYRHFENKEQLLVAVLHEGFEHFGRYLARGLRGTDARDRLRLTGLGYLDFALEQRPYYTMMFMAPREHLGLASVSDEMTIEASPTFTLLVDRVRECMAAGEIAEADPIEIAFGIWAHCHGLASLYLCGHVPPEVDFRAAYTRSVDSYVDGLA